MLLYPGAERRRIPNGPQTAGAIPPTSAQSIVGGRDRTVQMLNVSPGHSTPTHPQATEERGPKRRCRTQASEGRESRLGRGAGLGPPAGPPHSPPPTPWSGPPRPGSSDRLCSNLRLGAATGAAGEAASLSACVRPRQALGPCGQERAVGISGVLVGSAAQGLPGSIPWTRVPTQT